MKAGIWILGVLAAFGLLCALWALFGWLLPGLKGGVLVICGTPEPETFARIKLLRGLGFLDCPLILVGNWDQKFPDTEICSPEELPSRLEMERKRFDGTGNGDHSGHHQRGGVPEL